MNVHILRDAMAMQRWNDQKVANRAHAKTQREWDKLVIIIKQCSSLPKPILVKLTSEQLLQVLGLNASGVKNQDQKSIKINRTQELIDVLDFHEFKMIHGKKETIIIIIKFIDNFISSKVCQGFIWWFLGVYKVQGITKEKFVANAVQIEMQHRHLYITRHAIKATIAKVTY